MQYVGIVNNYCIKLDIVTQNVLFWLGKNAPRDSPDGLNSMFDASVCTYCFCLQVRLFRLDSTHLYVQAHFLFKNGFSLFTTYKVRVTSHT